MTAPIDPRSPLREFVKSHDFFIGIDSDGCAFDTMEVKHKECFIPNIIRWYQLAAISKYVRETAEFVNLYSNRRGINRFPGSSVDHRPGFGASRGLAETSASPGHGGTAPLDRAGVEALEPCARRPRSRRPATPTWPWPSNGARRSIDPSAKR